MIYTFSATSRETGREVGPLPIPAASEEAAYAALTLSLALLDLPSRRAGAEVIAGGIVYRLTQAQEAAEKEDRIAP